MGPSEEGHAFESTRHIVINSELLPDPTLVKLHPISTILLVLLGEEELLY